MKALQFFIFYYLKLNGMGKREGVRSSIGWVGRLFWRKVIGIDKICLNEHVFFNYKS